MLEAASIVIGYLLGAIPAAYIIGRWRRGIDIRTVDHGNVGAGNVFRQIGTWEGAIVVVVDMGKGVVAVVIARALGVTEIWVLAASFAAIVGHNFPVYIGFRGGQGVATILGIFLILTPIPVLIIFGLFAILLIITRRQFMKRLFLFTCVLSPLLPLLIWLIERSQPLTFYALIIVVLIVIKNAGRLKELKQIKKKGIDDT